MYDAAQELERFSTNAWRGRAEGLWYTIVIGPGRQADEVQVKFLDVIKSWLHIAEPIHRAYSLPCVKERFPAPEEIAPRLPEWFIENFALYTDRAVRSDEWRFTYISWLWAMEERCWNWWGYERNRDSLTVQLQVDGWPCPTGELVYVARVAGAESIIVDETLVYQVDAGSDQE